MLPMIVLPCLNRYETVSSPTFLLRFRRKDLNFYRMNRAVNGTSNHLATESAFHLQLVDHG